MENLPDQIKQTSYWIFFNAWDLDGEKERDACNEVRKLVQRRGRQHPVVFEFGTVRVLEHCVLEQAEVQILPVVRGGVYLPGESDAQRLCRRHGLLRGDLALSPPGGVECGMRHE